MKIYARLFLATALPVGALLGAFLSVGFGARGALAGLLMGVLFGTLVSLSLLLIHQCTMLRMRITPSDDLLSPYQRRVLRLRLPYERAFALCTLSLRTIRRASIHWSSREQGQLVAQVGLNWKTCGEVISFELSQLDDEWTEVRVVSRPARATTIVDMGKSLENVEQIVAFLGLAQWEIPAQRPQIWFKLQEQAGARRRA